MRYRLQVWYTLRGGAGFWTNVDSRGRFNTIANARKAVEGPNMHRYRIVEEPKVVWDGRRDVS